MANPRRSAIPNSSVPALPAATVTVRPLTLGESALIEFKAITDRNPSPIVAGYLLTDARKAAASFAKDSGAQTILAEIELNAGNNDEAEAAADRALAAQPDNRRAMCYKRSCANAPGEGGKGGRSGGLAGGSRLVHTREPR